MSRQQDSPDERDTKLNLVLGWAEELKRRIPNPLVKCAVSVF